MKSTNTWRISIPILVSVSVAAVLLIGGGTYESLWRSKEAKQQAEKFKQILEYVDKNYVDEIDLEQFTEAAISSAIGTLDPHSSYRSAREASWARAQLDGLYEGIGIECALFEDTLYVRRLISEGPAEEAGLEVGDQILCVDSLSLQMSGKDISEALKLIRGPKQTKLTLSIRRDEQHLSITFHRDEVSFSPIESVYIYRDQTAYVGMEWFSPNLNKLLGDTLAILKERGMKKLVLDLRGNTGGYMEAAIGVAEQFLREDQLILRTSGRHRPSTTYRAKKNGTYATLPLVLLMDEGSASASEIVIGALQDHERAVVIGRRSYGKALVQEAIRLIDDSELRLTVARYYTPKGRSIQRSYTSSQTDTTTRGGLTADLWIDEKEYPNHVLTLQKSGLLQAYARMYYVESSDEMSSLRAPTDIYELLRQRPLNVELIYQRCKICSERPSSDSLVMEAIAEELAYMRWGNWGYRQLILENDPYFLAAIKSLEEVDAPK